MQENSELGFDRPDTATLVIKFSGPFRFQDKIPSFDMVSRELNARDGLKKVKLDGRAITQWDSGCLTFILKIKKSCADAGVEVDVSLLPDGVRRLLHLAETVPERQGARRQDHKDSFLTTLGNVFLAAGENVKATLSFIGEVVIAVGNLIRGKAQFRKSDFWTIVQECGAEALPIVTLISVLVGMILSFLGAVQLKMFGAEIYVADLVGIGMVREMGALMTGIIMAGRTGAAFAARLGTMQVNEEIDALRTMGFSPMEFLVLPRMLALIFMMPLLCIYANFLGMIGGAIIGITMLDLTPIQYYTQTINAITMSAILSGLIKSVMFGILVALSGCMQGIHCGRSASAVGDATTRAVVSAIVYIVVVDSLMSIIYTMIGF